MSIPQATRDLPTLLA